MLDDPVLLAIERGVAGVGHRVKASATPGHAPTARGVDSTSILAVPADDSQGAGSQAPAGAVELLAVDWLTLCRRIADAQRVILDQAGGIAGRTVYEGVGEGGDRTLEIDRRCEDVVFAELDGLHAEGLEFTAVSEERGEVAFGDPGAPGRVVIDPIDGSLNARRTIPPHCVSIAVA